MTTNSQKHPQCDTKRLWGDTKQTHKDTKHPLRDARQLQKQLQKAKLFPREICSLFFCGCLATVYWMGSNTCLFPGSHFLKICPWQGEMFAYTDTIQHNKWPWKWISAFPSTSLKQVNTHNSHFPKLWVSLHFGFLSSILCVCPWCDEKCEFYTGHIAYSTVLPSQAHCLIVIIYIPLETFLSVLSAACYSHTPLHMSRLKALSLLHHALKAVYLTH